VPDPSEELGETGAYVHGLWSELFTHSGLCDCRRCVSIRIQLTEFSPLWDDAGKDEGGAR
jgi:hypothetical protein